VAAFVVFDDANLYLPVELCDFLVHLALIDTPEDRAPFRYSGSRH
jgi:hypothetical protein